MAILYVKAFAVDSYIGTSHYGVLTYVAFGFDGQPSMTTVVAYGTTRDTTTTPFPTFAEGDATGAMTYMGETQGSVTGKCQALVDFINSFIGTTIYTTHDLEFVDPPVLAAINNLAAVARSGSYLDLLHLPTIPSFTAQAHVVRASATAITSLPDNLPTNYNLISGVLGIATGLNGANAYQNTMADAVNAMGVLYNDLATKVNSIMVNLETLGLQAP